ncbi:MAG: TolC family protein [Myxococcales bacterium]|nr:TolC family protein [Myxococcales bacterium]
MRKLSLALSIGICFALGSTDALAQRRAAEGKRTLTVAIVQDGPSEAYDIIEQMIRTEITALMQDEVELRFLPADRVRGDWTEARSKALVDALFTRGDADVIVVTGPRTSRAMRARPTLEVPVIVPLVFDPTMLGLPRDGNRSGRKNLNYITGLDSILRDVQRFREVAPHERTVLLVDEAIHGNLSGIDRYMAEISAKVGGQVRIVAVKPSADAIIAALPTDAQGVILGGVPRLPWSEIDRVIAELRRRRLPSFTSLGPVYVERGVLATATPHEDWIRRARRVALHVQRIHLGEEAGELPVLFEPREALLINMKVARTIGVWPSFATLTEARLVNTGAGVKRRTLTLAQVVRDAERANLDLEIARGDVRAGVHAVDEARGRLLPSIRAGLDATLVEADAASVLGPAERTLGWSLSASQVLYSEGAWTDLDARSAQQRSREDELAQVRLDVQLQAAEAYIHVLRAKTAEQIQRENLQRTRSHLELAQVRQAVGVGRPNEVYRWQSEIANARRAVIEAVSRRNQAEIELNRVLRRPLEESIEVTPLALDTPESPLVDTRLLDYVGDPWSFRQLRAFMVQEAIERAPELDALDDALAAQERVVDGRRRSLYVPTVALTGGLTHELLTGGEGAGPEPLFPGTPAIERNSFVWQVGIHASVPLFEGTSNYAAIGKAEQELVQLRDRRAAVAQRIEQRVRSALHQAGASRPGIQLTRAASEAAGKNLELVEDAYRSGTLSVIDLVDASSQALVAELAAADARHNFMVDFVRAERAIGSFTFLRDSDARAALLQRLRRHLERQKEVSP